MTGGTGDSGALSGDLPSTGSPAARIVPGEMVGRSGDCRELDDLVEAVRRGLSRSLVIAGEPGIGKTRLLDYTARAADGVRTVSIAGLESELRLGFAALHRMLVPFLDRVGLLPAPQRDALGSAFGLAAGPSADRFRVGGTVTASTPVRVVCSNTGTHTRTGPSRSLVTGRPVMNARPAIVPATSCSATPAASRTQPYRQ